MKHAIGIDLGGAKTESILIAPEKTVLSRLRRPIPKEGVFDAMLAWWWR